MERLGLLLLLVSSILIGGCSSVATEPLMPTPLFFQVQGFSPLDDIPENEHWNIRKVYYATTRQRDDEFQRVNYDNKPDDRIHVGMTAVGFGSQNFSWSSLAKASLDYPRNEPVLLSLSGIFEVGSYKVDSAGDVTDAGGSKGWLAAEINQQLAAAKTKDILIYVHGAKVNFYNANVFAAQLDHFMGRDLVSVAFAWPTRQNILAYAVGDDMNRSYESAPALVSVLKQLSEHTIAERIHILTWSAGGRLVSTALKQLREQYPEMSPEQLRDKYRLGTVYFAAADVPAKDFVQCLPAINDVAQRIVVTASSSDGALSSSELFIRGGDRIGLLNPQLDDQERAIVKQADRLEYVDVSYGSEDRGFDITGHRYWFDHPWASTDLLLAIRGNLDPESRGLQKADQGILWWMPNDYPERVKAISPSILTAP